MSFLTVFMTTERKGTSSGEAQTAAASRPPSANDP